VGHIDDGWSDAGWMDRTHLIGYILVINVKANALFWLSAMMRAYV